MVGYVEFGRLNRHEWIERLCHNHLNESHGIRTLEFVDSNMGSCFMLTFSDFIVKDRGKSH